FEMGAAAIVYIWLLLFIRTVSAAAEGRPMPADAVTAAGDAGSEPGDCPDRDAAPGTGREDMGRRGHEPLITPRPHRRRPTARGGGPRHLPRRRRPPRRDTGGHRRGAPRRRPPDQLDPDRRDGPAVAEPGLPLRRGRGGARRHPPRGPLVRAGPRYGDGGQARLAAQHPLGPDRRGPR